MIEIPSYELNLVTGGECPCSCIDCDPGMDDSPRPFGITKDAAECTRSCEQLGRQYTGSCL